MSMKTKKRVLFSISKKSEIDAAFNFSRAIKKHFENVETCVVYVKDITKYEIFQNNINGYTMTNAATMVMGEYKGIEDNFYEEIKEKAKNYFDKVYSVTGEAMEVITEEMKAYDLLVIVRDEGNITSSLTDVIRSHYKPLVIIHENGKEFKFDKILMLNDGGYKVNKSVFSYFNIFGERNVDVLRVNVEDRDRLTERFGDICNLIHENGNEVEIISKYIPNYDIILMGGLNYPAFFERFTGQTGLKIIELSTKPIFIG
ncbi:hypothetical protein [Oceanivirga salmonicida]|uniref:hypothetical protein n=1 Tax=Oceanivirga salmonicida TaxID=1769291 RepID=UPI000836F25F|nr:hypothetical protein [Oceanivirga salmonicida]